MIPPIRDLYLRLMADWSGERAASAHPEIWDFTQTEIDYLERIQIAEDILNYEPTYDGRMEALAHECALALGLSVHDALGAAGDI